MVPLNASGKVDRTALPPPATAEPPVSSNAGPGCEPRFEETVAGIWEEALELEHVSVDDDFFEIGGHSLKAVRVLSRIEHRLGKT